MVNIKAAIQMLEHSDVGITIKIYHHVNAKSIREMHAEYTPMRTLQTV